MCFCELTNKMSFAPRQNFLGALDGTHIKLNVSMSDRPRYRSRKGDITTNVLGGRKMVSSYLSCLDGKGMHSIREYLEMQCHDLLV